MSRRTLGQCAALVGGAGGGGAGGSAGLRASEPFGDEDASQSRRLQLRREMMADLEKNRRKAGQRTEESRQAADNERDERVCAQVHARRFAVVPGI